MPVNLPPQNNANEPVHEEDIRELLKRNLELTEEILRLSRKTHLSLVWQNIFAVIKFAIILVPLIIGFLYLPPLIEKLLQQYSELMGISSGADQLQNIPLDMLKNLKLQ